MRIAGQHPQCDQILLVRGRGMDRSAVHNDRVPAVVQKEVDRVIEERHQTDVDVRINQIIGVARCGDRRQNVHDSRQLRRVGHAMNVAE